MLAAVRVFRTAPWYAAGLVGVVASALAAATSLFTLVDAVLFKPLPYREPNELYRAFGGVGGQTLSVSAGDVESWRRAQPSASLSMFRPMATTIGDSEVEGVEVDRYFWSTLGVSPAKGGFGSDAFEPSTAPVPVIISDGLWRSRFGAGEVRGLIIATASPPQRALEIVGVLPRSFRFPDPRQRPAVILPLRLRGSELADRRLRVFGLIVRRPTGSTEASVESALTADALANRAAYSPSLFEQRRAFDRVELIGLSEFVTRPIKVFSELMVLVGAVLVVLAAVTVAGLAGARAQERLQELETRRLLGATTIRLFSHLIGEVFVLTGVGICLASAVAMRLGPTWARMSAESPWLDVSPASPRAAVFAAMMGAVVVCVTAVAAWSISRRAQFSVGVRPGNHRSGSAWRGAVMASQVALSVALVLEGGLCLRSMQRLWNENLGFEAAGVYVAAVDLGEAPEATRLQRADSVLRGLRAVPDVEAASLFGAPFLQRAISGSAFSLPPGVIPDSITEMVPVSPGFFGVVKLPLIAGRLLTEDELSEGARLLVVSRRVAMSYWPGRDAVGQVLSGSVGTFGVVGVVDDGRFQAADIDSPGEIFGSAVALGVPRRASILVRVRSLEREVLSLARLESVDSAVRLSAFQSVESQLERTVTSRSFRASVSTTLAVAGLGIVGLGVFGVTAMTLVQRRREWAIRVAVGATAFEALFQTARRDVKWCVVGLACGFGLAAPIGQLLSKYLYKTAPGDPVVLLAVLCLVVGTVAVGFVIPAANILRAGLARVLSA